MAKKYPSEFLKKLKSVPAMRPKRVIDHILKHGQVTTEELKQVYGYNHPPRAARDVRELGIPLETIRVTGSDGRSIAAYRFGNPSQAKGSAHAGRIVLPKSLKEELIERNENRCAICSGTFDLGFLQVDHRVPYEVGGEPSGELNLDHYMLVCRACNRGKSWTCEHCPNWTSAKEPAVCGTCFWANPIHYSHIATIETRRLHLTWAGPETADYDGLDLLAHEADTPLPDYVKAILNKNLR